MAAWNWGEALLGSAAVWGRPPASVVVVVVGGPVVGGTVVGGPVVGGTVVTLDATEADATVVDVPDVTTVAVRLRPGVATQTTSATSRTVATTKGSRRRMSRYLRVGEWMRLGMSPSGYVNGERPGRPGPELPDVVEARLGPPRRTMPFASRRSRWARQGRPT
jgi:hypothetical protein